MVHNETGFRNPHPKRNPWNGWSYEFQIWQEYSQGPSEQKSIKNFGEKGAWAYPRTAHIFTFPHAHRVAYW